MDAHTGESQDVVVLMKTWEEILLRICLEEVEDFRPPSDQDLSALHMSFQPALVAEEEDTDSSNPNSKESERTLKSEEKEDESIERMKKGDKKI
jgi:hypothetical protein